MTRFISSNDIHLWYALDEEIVDPRLLEQCFAVLSDEEKQRQSRFHFSRHRHQYLVTRALIRTLLSHHTDHAFPPAHWQFGENDYGRPHVTNLPSGCALQFNISHTEKMVVIALSNDSEIGVDVEYLNKDRNFMGLAKSSFSPEEQSDLYELDEEKRKDRFYDLWTLKEAYIKAKGMGLAIPLDQFSFSFEGEDNLRFHAQPSLAEDESLWRFWQFQSDESHHLIALACKSQHVSTRAIQIRQIVPSGHNLNLNANNSHLLLQRHLRNR